VDLLMSEYETNDDTQDDEGYNDPNAVRNLREANKRMKADLEAATTAAAEATGAKRELTLIRAGIDLDSPQGKLFAKAYDGDLSVEAVKEQAAEYGLMKPEVPAASPELLAQQAVGAVSQGASQASPDITAEIANAQSVDEVMAIVARAGVPTSYETPAAPPVPWT